MNKDGSTSKWGKNLYCTKNRAILQYVTYCKTSSSNESNFVAFLTLDRFEDTQMKTEECLSTRRHLEKFTTKSNITISTIWPNFHTSLRLFTLQEPRAHELIFRKYLCYIIYQRKSKKLGPIYYSNIFFDINVSTF